METIDPKDSVQNEQFNSVQEEIETTTHSNMAVNEPVKTSKSAEILSDLLIHHVDEAEDDEEINMDPSNISEDVSVIHDGEEPAEDYSELNKEELITKLTAIISSKQVEKIRLSVESIKINFYKRRKAEVDKLRKDAEDAGILEFVVEIDPSEEKLKDLLKKYRDARNVYNQKIEGEKQKNLHEKYRIIEEIKELVNRKESINDTFHQFRELQNQWRAIGVVPQQNINDLWETYHHYVEIFYDFIKINKELRDLDLKKNLELKIGLCEKAEALLLEPSVVKAFKTLQKQHEQWREIGPVPQEMKTEIWERFKNITSKINKKHQDYFDNLKLSQKKNLESKTALCERAEEISALEVKNIKEWEASYQEMIDLQKVWRTIGFAPKKDNNKIYNRFRTACDQYFNRKREFFAHNKEEQTNNLQLKTDLCIQAESLKESSEWKATTEDLINLQKKWKEIGPVPRKYSDSIWKRFRAACDYFFNKKAEHYNSIDSQYDDNYKLKLELISLIENFVPGNDAETNFLQLKEYQRQWSEIGFVPLKHKEEIQKSYRDAINKHFDNLKIDDGKKNMLKFKNKIENISSKNRGGNKLYHERDKYIIKLKQLEGDIILWENNIGFFAKSKNAESMIAEVQRKIQQGKDEIKMLEEKIHFIDDSMDDEG